MTSNLPQKDLTSFFRPEFINRIDDIINFESLTKEQISKIVGFSIKALAKRLEERDISVEINDEAVMLIADEAYDPIYGARPVKRYIQKNIENEIAKMVISGDIGSGSIVYIDTYNGKLNYKVR